MSVLQAHISNVVVVIDLLVLGKPSFSWKARSAVLRLGCCLRGLAGSENCCLGLPFCSSTRSLHGRLCSTPCLTSHSLAMSVGPSH